MENLTGSPEDRLSLVQSLKTWSLGTHASSEHLSRYHDLVMMSTNKLTRRIGA
jgi:hypothetical protein